MFCSQHTHFSWRRSSIPLDFFSLGFLSFNLLLDLLNGSKSTSLVQFISQTLGKSILRRTNFSFFHWTFDFIYKTFFFLLFSCFRLWAAPWWALAWRVLLTKSDRMPALVSVSWKKTTTTNGYLQEIKFSHSNGVYPFKNARLYSRNPCCFLPMISWAVWTHPLPFWRDFPNSFFFFPSIYATPPLNARMNAGSPGPETNQRKRKN
jgi:hypothetical protein